MTASESNRSFGNGVSQRLVLVLVLVIGLFEYEYENEYEYDMVW